MIYEPCFWYLVDSGSNSTSQKLSLGGRKPTQLALFQVIEETIEAKNESVATKEVS